MEPTISDAELLELAGEDALEVVKELTLRGRKITTFEPYVAKLPCLQALSLSHNQLQELRGFYQLNALATLNVNANALTSLAGIEQCSSLQQLFASNNKLRDLAALAGLANLQTVNVFNNSISSLDDCIQVLSGLPVLRDVELGGNPAATVPDYKPIMILNLPALEVLDGDTLTQLDRDMAEECAAGSAGQTGGTAQILVVSEETTEAADKDAAGDGSQEKHRDRERPWSGSRTEGNTYTNTGKPGSAPISQQILSTNLDRTAHPLIRPMSGLHRPGTAATAGRPGTALRPGTASGARPGTPGGFTSQLVSDDLLNDNPVLLEYMAKFVLAEGLAAAQQGSGYISTGSKLRGTFAQRLRNAANAMSSTEGMPATVLASSAAVQGVFQGSSQLDAVREVVSTATPQELIRQLVKLSEVLIKELEAARQATGQLKQSGSRPATAPTSQCGNTRSGISSTAAAQSTSSVQASDPAVSGPGATEVDEEAVVLRAEVEKLRREVKRLELENQNMYWLADEYKRLKAELAQVTNSSIKD